MKAPNYREIAADFLSRAVVTDHDLCLDFNETPASHIVGKRINLQAATDFTDITAKFGLCIGLENPDISRVLKHARRAYFWIPAKKPFWKWVRAMQVAKGRILYAEQGNFGYKLYVTAYTSVQDLDDFSAINVGDDLLEKNIRANLALGIREVEPCKIQEQTEVALVFGGPSINDFADQLYEQAKSGIPVITANGAYNWCLEHKIIPAAQIVLDARAFNRRFVEPVKPQTKYLICSQCDPSLFEALPREQTWIWHPYGELYNRVIKEYFGEQGTEHNWYPVPGGTTVALRGIPLMMMLGYKKFHVYGFDSCIMDTHHGYLQPEDDKKRVMVVEWGGRKFSCYPWMVHQCSDFMKMTRHMIGQLCEMEIYGDGLIAHCIRTLGETDGSDEMAVLQQREDQTSQWWVRPGHTPDENGAVQEQCQHFGELVQLLDPGAAVEHRQ